QEHRHGPAYSPARRPGGRPALPIGMRKRARQRRDHEHRSLSAPHPPAAGVAARQVLSAGSVGEEARPHSCLNPTERSEAVLVADSASAIDVLGIGNALVDVLSHESEEFIRRQGLVKGTMHLVDEARARALYAAMGPGVEVSGGSAANTIVGVASFGGRAH